MEARDSAIITLAVGSLVWIGLLIGVSFLATPVKFLAPTWIAIGRLRSGAV